MFGRCPLRQRLDLQRRARRRRPSARSTTNSTSPALWTSTSTRARHHATHSRSPTVISPGRARPTRSSPPPERFPHTFDGYGDGTTIMAGNYPFRITYQANAVVLTALLTIRHLNPRGDRRQLVHGRKLARQRRPQSLRHPGLPRQPDRVVIEQQLGRQHRIHLDQHRRQQLRVHRQCDFAG